MATRSKRLGIAASSAAVANSTVLYTCPPATTAIAKDVRTANANASANLIQLIYQQAGGPQVFLMNESHTGGQIDSRACWIVLEAGDKLTWGCALGQASILISGCELPD